MNRISFFFTPLIAVLLFMCSSSFAAGPIQSGHISMKIDGGWKGLYALNEEYIEFSLIGNEIQQQDGAHFILMPHVGMMVTFADKKSFGTTSVDQLSAHAQWEIDYWKTKASKVESTNRDDLIAARKDIKVTEITLSNNKGAQKKIYLIGLTTKDGVFVLSISPDDRSIDPMVKNILSTLKLVNKRLDAEEITRLSALAASKKL